MKIYVSTCDKYDHLLPGFAYLFNKYWGPDQEVHVLGFRQPPELPSNFVFHSMEPVETVPWSTNMRNFFSQIEDDHFIFLFDDYWLTHPVDRIKVDEYEKLLVEDKLAKVDLTFYLKMYPHDDYKEGLFKSRRENLFRLSTQPAIWSKKFWMKWMNPGLSPWGFEIAQDAFDDEIIVGAEKSVYLYNNMSEKGKPRQFNIDRLPDEDKKLLVVPLTGKIENGKFSNVFVEQLKRWPYPDGYFEVKDLIVTSITLSIKQNVSVNIAYELVNSTGHMIRNAEKTYLECQFLSLLGVPATQLLEQMKALVPKDKESPSFQIYTKDQFTAQKKYVTTNKRGSLTIAVEKLNTQQLVEAITPMTLAELCDTVALLKDKLFV